MLDGFTMALVIVGAISATRQIMRFVCWLDDPRSHKPM